jgi:hypothetical protein
VLRLVAIRISEWGDRKIRKALDSKTLINVAIRIPPHSLYYQTSTWVTDISWSFQVDVVCHPGWRLLDCWWIDVSNVAHLTSYTLTWSLQRYEERPHLKKAGEWSFSNIVHSHLKFSCSQKKKTQECRESSLSQECFAKPMTKCTGFDYSFLKSTDLLVRMKEHHCDFHLALELQYWVRSQIMTPRFAINRAMRCELHQDMVSDIRHPAR